MVTTPCVLQRSESGPESLQLLPMAEELTTLLSPKSFVRYLLKSLELYATLFGMFSSISEKKKIKHESGAIQSADL